MQRRIAFAAVTLAAAAIAGCGFELRRAPELKFSTLALAGFLPRSELAEALRKQLATSATTRVVEAVSQAQVVLEALTDARDKSVVASTAAGQVRELTLRTRLRFRLHTPAGHELIAPTEISLSRDLSYSETSALAKEQEELFLYRAMDVDIAQQVLRRLAAVRLAA
jgi:LPS-assembly lipoprotein